jgi:competence protein ComEC
MYKNISKKEWLMIFALETLFLCFFIYLGVYFLNSNFVFKAFHVVGDAILIKTPQNHHILIDGGIKNDVILEKLNKEKTYFNQEVDALVVTHTDYDHINGAYSVLKHFPVKQIFLPINQSNKQVYIDFLSEAQKKNVPVYYLNNTQDLKLKNIYFETLNPNKIEKKDNNSSIVFKIKTQNKTIFTGGDIEKSIEKELLMSDVSLKSDLLKISHHGSKTSSIEDFLLATLPTYSITSAGAENPYKHPYKEVVDRINNIGIQNKITKEKGDISFIINPKGDILFTSQK